MKVGEDALYFKVENRVACCGDTKKQLPSYYNLEVGVTVVVVGVYLHAALVTVVHREIATWHELEHGVISIMGWRGSEAHVIVLFAVGCGAEDN